MATKPELLRKKLKKVTRMIREDRANPKIPKGKLLDASFIFETRRRIAHIQDQIKNLDAEKLIEMQNRINSLKSITNEKLIKENNEKIARADSRDGSETDKERLARIKKENEDFLKGGV